MWLFGRVERLQQRLRVMIFIGNFNENVRTIGPQLKAVISASMSIRNSEKLKKILEIILAFGNYMNSGKRGSVYGFKLTSLEALVETKSTDKSQNLLHYICNVVHSYFSDVADFMCEIRYVDQGIVRPKPNLNPTQVGLNYSYIVIIIYRGWQFEEFHFHTSGTNTIAPPKVPRTR